MSYHGFLKRGLHVLIISNYKQNESLFISSSKNSKDKGSKSLLKTHIISYTTNIWLLILKKLKSSLKQLITYTCFPLINIWQTDSIVRIYSSSVVDVFRILHYFYIQSYLSLKQRNNETFMLDEQKCLLTFYILKGV